MGTVSVNKLGGLSLIIGPVLALVCYLIRPGGPITDSADPANAAASIKALMSNSDLASVTSILLVIGLILLLNGVRTLRESLRGGNGDALAGLGSLLLLIAAVGWVIGTALTATIAGGGAGTAAGALYAASLGIGISSGMLAGLAFLCVSLGVSTRDDSNKPLALVVAVASAVAFITSILGGRDLSTLEMMNNIGAVCYIITTVWAITLGLSLMKKA